MKTQTTHSSLAPTSTFSQNTQHVRSASSRCIYRLLALGILIFGMTFVSQLQAQTTRLESRYVLGRLPSWSAYIAKYEADGREGYKFRAPSGAEYMLIQYPMDSDHRACAFAKNGAEHKSSWQALRAEVDARRNAYIVAWRQIAIKDPVELRWYYNEKSNGLNSHYYQVYVTTGMGIHLIIPERGSLVEMMYGTEYSCSTSDYDIIQLARAVADGAQEQLATRKSTARAEAAQPLGKSSSPADLKTFFVGTWTWKDPDNSNIWHSMSLSSDGSAMYYWRNPNQEPILQMWPFAWKATGANSISLGGRIYTLRDGKLYEAGNVKDGFVKATKSK